MQRVLVASALSLAVACKSEPPPPVVVAVGASAEDRVEFSPRSAFAEYVELPGVKNELRITLASYEASCERFIAPERGQASLTVVVVTPSGVEPTKGAYGWNGESLGEGSRTAAYAAPSARIGPRSHVLPPGGSVELSGVDLDLHGKVEGRLAFEFAGSAERAATQASGPFSARVCRSKRARP